MPESPQDSEVEEVLAAIRRLIVDGSSRVRPPAPPQPEPLLLTPALLVREGRPTPSVPPRLPEAGRASLASESFARLLDLPAAAPFSSDAGPSPDDDSPVPEIIRRPPEPLVLRTDPVPEPPALAPELARPEPLVLSAALPAPLVLGADLSVPAPPAETPEPLVLGADMLSAAPAGPLVLGDPLPPPLPDVPVDEAAAPDAGPDEPATESPSGAHTTERQAAPEVVSDPSWPQAPEAAEEGRGVAAEAQMSGDSPDFASVPLADAPDPSALLIETPADDPAPALAAARPLFAEGEVSVPVAAQDGPDALPSPEAQALDLGPVAASTAEEAAPTPTVAPFADVVVPAPDGPADLPAEQEVWPSDDAALDSLLPEEPAEPLPAQHDGQPGTDTTEPPVGVADPELESGAADPAPAEEPAEAAATLTPADEDEALQQDAPASDPDLTLEAAVLNHDAPAPLDIPEEEPAAPHTAWEDPALHGHAADPAAPWEDPAAVAEPDWPELRTAGPEAEPSTEPAPAPDAPEPDDAIFAAILAATSESAPSRPEEAAAPSSEDPVPFADPALRALVAELVRDEVRRELASLREQVRQEVMEGLNAPA